MASAENERPPTIDRIPAAKRMLLRFIFHTFLESSLHFGPSGALQALAGELGGSSPALGSARYSCRLSQKFAEPSPMCRDPSHRRVVTNFDTLS